jgi:anaerobic ribonucleoside-triphosphate reductase activating protein
MLKNPLLSGVTLSGGEPFMQSAACLEIAKAAHEANLNVWAYTGYTWERLMQENDPGRMALLHEIDVLVDGPYIAEKRSLELDFCGSSNQRVIDVQQSLLQGEVVIRRVNGF